MNRVRTGNDNFDSVAHYFRGEIRVSVTAAVTDVEPGVANIVDLFIGDQLLTTIPASNSSGCWN